MRESIAARCVARGRRKIFENRRKGLERNPTGVKRGSIRLRFKKKRLERRSDGVRSTGALIRGLGARKGNDAAGGDLVIAGCGSGGLAGETESMILGSFESIFGPAENYVNFYWNETGGAIGLESRNSSDEFYFSAPPASEYAAFGNGGMLVYRSYNVPEPGALALLGLAALAALSATRRRLPD